LTKAYIYANGEILVQHDGYDCMANRCFYLHDRLGSVRQVISYETNVQVLNSYTYGPFGEMIAADCAETIDNPFKFTGQWFDPETGWYYLRARMYDPQLMRFTGRDSFDGDREEPLTLHKYLYCSSDPINFTDPSGNFELGETLVSNAILSSLQGMDSSFSTQLLGESIRAADIFNVIGLEQAVQTEMLVAQFDSGLGRSCVSGIVSAFNMVVPHLTDKVLANKMLKFTNYFIGDAIGGNLSWLLEDPTMLNFEKYLNRWGSRNLGD
jgi:RHS repeat-associated protein